MIILTGIPGATRMIMAGSDRLTPDGALVIVMLALLVLAVGVVACTHAADRTGQSLREWWDSLR
jgi:hypothetical protein